MNSHAVLVGVGALACWMAPVPAHAISQYVVSVHATLTLEGPAADLITVLDVADHVAPESDSTGLPSFANSTGSVSWDPDTRTLTVIAQSNGAANFAGGIPQAIAYGISRVRGTIGLINPFQDIGFLLEVRVHATFEFAGLLSDPAEYAETVFDLQFAGTVFEGLPADGRLVTEDRTTTADPGLGNGFDLLTTTEFLGVEETYTIVIPPGGSGLDILDLGLFVQAGGATASRVDGTTVLALEYLPEAPAVLLEDQFVDADGDGVHIGDDRCPDTVVPESVPTARLVPRRWALVDDDAIFDTVRPGPKPWEHAFTLADTAGCSCEQIIGALGLGHGHKKFGCSTGVMRRWIRN
jgi:hypothetical protein